MDAYFLFPQSQIIYDLASPDLELQVGHCNSFLSKRLPFIRYWTFL